MKTFRSILLFMMIFYGLSMTSCVNEPFDGVKIGDITVTSIDDQVMAVKTSVDQLTTVADGLTEYVGSVVKITGQEMTGLELSVSELGAVCDGLNDQIRSLGSSDRLGGTLATLECQKIVADVVGTLEGRIRTFEAGLDQDLLGKVSSEYDRHLASSLKELRKGISEWLGDQFGYYYRIAEMDAMADCVLAGLGCSLDSQKADVDGVLSDVEAGLRKMDDTSELTAVSNLIDANIKESDALAVTLDELAENLFAEYGKAIEYAVSGLESYSSDSLVSMNRTATATLKSTSVTLNDLISRVQKCESDIAAILSRLDDLENEIDGLVDMIQSISFVSEYSDDNAVAYYSMSGKVSDASSPYFGYGKRNPAGTLSLSFIVRPAAAAKALANDETGAGVIGYYAQSADSRALSASDFITFGAPEIKLANETRGLITVTVSHNLKEDFYYKEIGAKVALSVVSGKTDITSRFVGLVPKDNSSVVYVDGINLSTDEITMDLGTEKTISATVAPSSATVSNVVWSSGNTEIVTVDSSTGKIKAVGVGTAIVTATTIGVDEWGHNLTASCKVNVQEAVRLSGPTYVEVGKEAQLFLDYPASMIVNSKQWWINSNYAENKNLASVNQSGVVTALQYHYGEEVTTNGQVVAEKGYRTVTVSCQVNETVVSHTMKVVAPQPTGVRVANLADNVNEISVKLDRTFDLAAEILPAAVHDGGLFRILYSIDAKHYEFAEIINTSIVRAKKEGITYAVVDVYPQEGFYYFAPGTDVVRRSIKVNVERYFVKSISLADVEVSAGLSTKLVPVLKSDVDGVAPTNPGVTFKSSNTSVATVASDGTVKAIKAGTTTITVTSTDNPSVSAACTVKVTAPWQSFTVGDYILNDDGKISFASSVTTANRSKIIGVVISDTDPSATDRLLPEDCVHGLAVAIGEGSGIWWNNAPSTEPWRLYQWALANGYESTMGVDWAPGGTSAKTDNAGRFMGYNNTSALKEFISYNGLTSGILEALNQYSVSRPSGTSVWYLPSVAEMDAIVANYDKVGSKLSAVGTGLSNELYWTSSDDGNTTSNAVTVNPVTGAFAASHKENTYKVRYIIAF